MEMRPVRTLISPNFNDRAGDAVPSVIVLHYTGTRTGAEAESFYINAALNSQSGKISPHYMIDYDGTITQFVAEEKRAWHAGQSWWGGMTDLNSSSIGIELVNPGHDLTYIPFTTDQMGALAELAKDIFSRYPIQPWNVVGHSDISPAYARNKPDPGELMDWEWLSAQGIGLFPAPERQDYDAADAAYIDITALRQGLNAYGYDPHVSDAEAVSAFQRHFHAETHLQGRAGMADRETGARLHWLLRYRGIHPGGLP